MDALEIVILTIATALALVGGAVVLRRELTAPDRRRVGVVRDLIEVLLPIAGLVLLVILVWSMR